MISKLASRLSGLIFNNMFNVSRQKTLLKRRKIGSKKQKIAKKKFLEHNPDGSYTNELKILQIQKQLDRKVSKNHHLNQLMDELFYPDVRYANEQLMQQNLMKLSANPQQTLALRKKSNDKVQNQTEDQYEQYDQLAEQIYLCQIPSQLFELYLKNSQFFTHQYLIIFLQKLEFYFKNRQTIQQRVTEKWKKSLDKIKLTDMQKKKRKRCPYVFIEQQQLIREEDWNKIVKDIYKKISLSTQHISKQVQQQNTQTQSIQSLDQGFYSLENNCVLVLQIYSAANYLPEQIFSCIVQKTFAICDFNQTNSQSSQQLAIFSHSEKVKLLKVIALKSSTKSTLTKTLHIESPELSQKEEHKIVTLGQKLCEDIIKSYQCSAEDLGAVITSQQGQYKFLNSFLLDLAKPKMIQFLSKTSLQRSIDYLGQFYRDGNIKQVSFIEILMFDIYRKLPYSVSKRSLFYLLSIIKNTRIAFQKSELSISIASIYPRIAESMTKYLYKNLLTHEEVKTFIDSIFRNYPAYKAQNRANILEMATTTIVKIGEGFKLQELTELVFKCTLMGYTSKIFSKYVFERYQKEYRTLMRQYKSQKVQLIPDKNTINQTLGEQQVAESASLEEILLQENLMMMLWSYVISLNSQNVSLPLNDMIEIYPLYIQSQDPMIGDLRDDLNQHLKEYNFFPQIKHKSEEVKFIDNRKSKVKNFSCSIKTNTFQQYKHEYIDAVSNQLTRLIEDGKQPISNQTFEDLVFYLIRYCILYEHNIKNVRVPQRWNDTTRKVFAQRREIQQNIYNKFLQLIQDQKQGGSEKVSTRLIKILQNRQKQNSDLQSGKQDKNTQKGYKLYELL